MGEMLGEIKYNIHRTVQTKFDVQAKYSVYSSVFPITYPSLCIRMKMRAMCTRFAGVHSMIQNHSEIKPNGPFQNVKFQKFYVMIVRK